MGLTFTNCECALEVGGCDVVPEELCDKPSPVVTHMLLLLQPCIFLCCSLPCFDFFPKSAGYSLDTGPHAR